MEDPVSTESVRATIRRGNPQSSLGPSGLRSSHLQEVMTPDLCEALGQLSRLIVEGTFLPDRVWQLHMCLDLSVIGTKYGPVLAGMPNGKLGEPSVDSKPWRLPVTSKPSAKTESQQQKGLNRSRRGLPLRTRRVIPYSPSMPPGLFIA